MLRGLNVSMLRTGGVLGATAGQCIDLVALQIVATVLRGPRARSCGSRVGAARRMATFVCLAA